MRSKRWRIVLTCTVKALAVVMELCDHIYVLDFGRLIYEGTAADVLSAEIVKAAYLGSEAGGLSDAGT